MNEIEIVKNTAAEPFAFQAIKGEVAGRGMGPIGFFGLEMSQNQNAIIVWDTFFKYLQHLGEKPARIIEIGTGSGGFSVLLYLYCRSIGAQFVTYDVPERGDWSLKHEFPGIVYRLADTTLPETIAVIGEMIQSEGISILLCDANKILDWNALAPYLKVGDYISAHDYAPSEDYFHKHMLMKLWSFIHIKDEDIQESCEQYHLEPVLPEMFLTAAWVCKKRT